MNNNCFNMVSQYFDCMKKIIITTPYDNFTIGSFVYEPKNEPNVKIVFNSLDNEFQTCFDYTTDKKKFNIYKFSNRTQAINFICNNVIKNKNIQNNELRQAFHYYDN